MSSLLRLDGKTALVTGASQGIGEATARLLASQGARVVVAARNLEKLQSLAGELVAQGSEAMALKLDLSRPPEVETRLQELPTEYRDIDILISNAGVTQDTLLARMTLEQWQQVLNTNLTGAYAVTRQLVRGMIRRRWGRIICVSSVAGLMGNPGQANYAASKAGLIGFSKSLARELGSRNITVNVVAPGYITTAMTETLPEVARSELFRGIPLGRFGSVEDVSNAILFLAGEQASYVTGHVLNVSGGLYM